MDVRTDMTKLCECGCGQPVSLRIRKGQPTRFVQGHGGRGRMSGPLSEERRQKLRDAQLHDLTGQRFGDWQVLAHAGSRPTRWECICVCGEVREIFAGNLVRGVTTSCGCQRVGRPVHGHCRANESRTPEYNSWRSMKDRCSQPSHRDWPLYGGRGITICDRWLEPGQGFLNFLADMGERPEGKTLDRINSEGNYEPMNCRWADEFEQAHNRRTPRRAP